MDDRIFQRYEIKYMVDGSLREAVISGMSSRMVPDPHGKSTICNVYFDTPDFRLIRRSLEKPVYKEKFRVRSYGRCSSGDKVFVELKKKYDGVVYKRRISLTEAECADWLAGRAPLPEDSQIGRELEYCRRFYKGLAPRVYLCYDRDAFYDREDDSFRVTFDRNIRYRETDLSLTSEPGGRLILPDEYSLMEIKTGGAIPLWFVEIISKHRLSKASFSKYGTAYGIILKEKLEKGNRFVRGYTAVSPKAKEENNSIRERGRTNDRYAFFGNNDNRQPLADSLFN